MSRTLPGLLLIAGLLAAHALPATAQTVQTTIQVGILGCDVAAGTGFVFGSTKSLTCVFQRQGARDEFYTGTISKFGIDIGQTSKSVIQWAVLAPGKAIPRGALAGTYGGISGEATVGVGIGANALIGGLKNSVSLQPLSVQAQQGLNLAAGIAALTLEKR